MGYTLEIGEAVIDWSEEMVRIDVEGKKLDDAPAFGEPTDYTNARWPSYTSWADFCRNVGIYDVVMDKQWSKEVGNCTWIYCLMPSHPGEAPITKHHLEIIEAKVNEYKEKHPDHIAKYPPPKEGAEPIFGGMYREEDLVTDPKYDGNLCRAEWLLFWMRWALENCKNPVFINGNSGFFQPLTSRKHYGRINLGRSHGFSS